MNNNIFSPKGTISQSLFIFYYILLMVIYIFGGLLLILYVAKHHLNFMYFILPLLIIKFLIL